TARLKRGPQDGGLFYVLDVSDVKVIPIGGDGRRASMPNEDQGKNERNGKRSDPPCTGVPRHTALRHDSASCAPVRGYSCVSLHRLGVPSRSDAQGRVVFPVVRAEHGHDAPRSPSSGDRAATIAAPRAG